MSIAPGLGQSVQARGCRVSVICGLNKYLSVSSAALVHARALTCLPKGIFNSFGVTRDDSQQDPRGTIRSRATLFPVLQCRWLEPEFGGKFGMGEA